MPVDSTLNKGFGNNYGIFQAWVFVIIIFILFWIFAFYQSNLCTCGKNGQMDNMDFSEGAGKTWMKCFGRKSKWEVVVSLKSSYAFMIYLLQQLLLAKETWLIRTKFKWIHKQEMLKCVAEQESQTKSQLKGDQSLEEN